MSDETSPDFDAQTPEDLLARDDLDREQKIAVLRQWELDLRERMVAEEENMPSSLPMRMSLDEVLNALNKLQSGAERLNPQL